MKYYLNNRDNRANLAANDFDEFFRPFWSMGEFSPKTVYAKMTARNHRDGYAGL